MTRDTIRTLRLCFLPIHPIEWANVVDDAPYSSVMASCSNQEISLDVREIANLKNAQPFVPFRILLADGREFAVNHPDFLARSPTGRSVVLYDATGVYYLDVRLIAELRHPESSSRPE